jgi:hypothetical protein
MNINMDDTESNGSSLLALTLFGFLSMIFAEVFSGSSPLWFLSVWGWTVTLPLYWAHAVFLLNLAVRYKRTSLRALYLWGVIFGLYESWITKVLWAGYIGESPQIGTFLGFAVGEFMVIGLFWHAVFSFIVPILVFEIIVFSINKDPSTVLSSHFPALLRRRRNIIVLYLVMLIGSLFITMGLAQNLSAISLAILGNGLLLAVLIHFTRKRKSTSIHSLILGKTGMNITIIYLVGLYIITFLFLLPWRRASLETMLLTLSFYLVVINLITLSPRDKESTEPSQDSILNLNQVKKAFLVFVLLAVAWSLFREVGFLLGTLSYIGMLILGPSIFVLVILSIARYHLRHKEA